MYKIKKRKLCLSLYKSNIKKLKNQFHHIGDTKKKKENERKSCDRSSNRGAKCNICLSPYLPIYVHVCDGDLRISNTLFSITFIFNYFICGPFFFTIKYKVVIIRENTLFSYYSISLLKFTGFLKYHGYHAEGKYTTIS